jgi:endonuclease/exonuclease/phosphatase family metal-dependent hydrolase
MLRVMTYNVHGGVGADGRLDLGRIAAVIAQARPDIVALQELDVGRPRSGGVDQAHALAARLGMTCQFNAAFSVAEERYGDAILTALPQTLIKAGPLPTPRLLRRLEPRGAVWTAVETPLGQVQVINTHLGLTPQEQKVQVRALLAPDWLGRPECAGPTILLGDMNATARYAAYRALATRLRDVQRGPDGARLRRKALRTFPARLPLLRLDHIFIGGGLDVVGVTCPNSALARAASDHRPLVAELHLPGNAALSVKTI